LPSENGGSTILSYNLQWDNGNGVVNVNLVGYSTPYLHPYFTVISGVTAGALYNFKYRARNVYGWGDFSDEVTLKAARQPEQMLPVQTLIENNFVKISWDYPNDNSDTVNEYEVLIRESDLNTYKSEILYCDGRSQAIIQKRYCLIPMTVLRAAPYSLQFQNYLAVKIRAKNALGWGLYSDLNSL